MSDDGKNRTIYYKVNVWVTEHEWTDEGEGKEIGMWEENPNCAFKTIAEAEEWIKDNYDMNDFVYTTMNGYDELQGSRIIKEHEGEIIQDYTIYIRKYIVEDTDFNTLREDKE